MKKIECRRTINAPSEKWEIKTKKKVAGIIQRNSLGKGMSISHSTSFFTESIESSLIEKGHYVNFVFLLSGELHLKLETVHTWKNMIQAKAYMFFSENNTRIRRRVAPRNLTEAVIIKIPEETFMTMVSDMGGFPYLRNMGTLIYSQNMSAHDLMLCNQLKFWQKKSNGQTGQIICRGRSMELVALTFLQGQGTETESSIVLELADYIRNHVDQVHSLKKLSAMAGMSHTKLNSIFRVRMGVSVFEFIRRQRLLQAETYLHQSDMNISQIAYEVGFCSSSHFSEMFKRYKGVSPKTFRKMIVKE